MKPSEEEQIFFVKTCAFLTVPVAGASISYLSARSKEDLAAFIPFGGHPDAWYALVVITFLVSCIIFGWCYSGLSRRGNAILFVSGIIVAAIHVWFTKRI